jgi:hypothetical protein
MRGSVAIAGVGLAGCGEAPGWSEMEIAAAAAKNALDDAGLTARDVDGVVVASTNIFMSGLALSEHLGLRPKFTESTMVGGSSFVGHLIPAALALNAGLCDTVLVAYGSNQRTGVGRGEGGRYKMALDPQVFEHPYKPFNPLMLSGERNFGFGDRGDRCIGCCHSALCPYDGGGDVRHHPQREQPARHPNLMRFWRNRNRSAIGFTYGRSVWTVRWSMRNLRNSCSRV